MNDRALRYFLAVVRTGSIRAAAETLNVAASAVSRQVAEMEAASGMVLLERLPRGVMPTEAGRVVAEHAQRCADESDLLDDRLRSLRGAQHGTVRIWCGYGFIPDLMEYGLAPFAAAFPGISFTVSIGNSAAIQTAVAVGDADIGIAFSPAAHPGVRTALMSHQPLSAIVWPGHPLVGVRHPVELRMFATEPVVLPPQGFSMRQLLGRVEADGNFRLIPRLETNSAELQRRFVTMRLGVAFMPYAVAVIELQQKRLHAIPLSDVLLSQTTAHLLVRCERRLPGAVERLVKWLGDNLTLFKSVPEEPCVAGIATVQSKNSACRDDAKS